MAEGTPSPLGVVARENGLNVAVVSQNATRIFFCLFEGDKETSRLALPKREGDVHFGFVAGLGIGTRYGFRAEGPWDEAQGHRFDSSKLLADPYAGAIDRPFAHTQQLLQRRFDTAQLVPKSIVTAPFDAMKPLPPATPGFIYEIQVKGFSQLHPDVPLAKRGTVAALAEPAIIDHFIKLGIDTVEIMPLAAWIDERHLPTLGLANAWGYNPVTFTTPDPRLAPGGFTEIRQTVAALHSAGIRVILDAVFNHTGESDEEGATLSLRGLDNALYYAHADGQLVNHTGCGNTLALDRAPVMQLVLDAMRNWVDRTGIDGFRFDLATVMGRTENGFSRDAPLISAIEHDPLLSKLIMIAEPWDVGPGGYRLGQFPARWHEWNDRFRDDVRRFWRGGHDTARDLATRLAGSSDIFGSKSPSRGINYVASHDGFTLQDAVTYETKNNHANGEGNRDGNSQEVTWVGGDVQALLATLFLSRGTPMLTAGDEFGHSQQGNNNAYAQDNATTWLDWKSAGRDLIAFTAKLVELRKTYPLLAADRFLTGEDATWLSADGAPMDWNNGDARVLGLLLTHEEERLAIWVNGAAPSINPPLQPRDGYSWLRVFCSAEGPGLPGLSVSLFTERRIQQAGIPDETLLQVAAAAGVEREWWEIDGTHHKVSPVSLRSMLTALRVPHATADEAQASLRNLREVRLPLLAIAGQPIPLGEAANRHRRLNIIAEGGTATALDVAPGVVPAAELSMGYYDVWADGSEDAKHRVIVSPGKCFLPEIIADGGRVFGFASHLYALRHDGDGGIGDFETLRRFADVTASSGGAFAGINPLHHLFPADRTRASPYQPSDRRYIDPIYINIAALLEAFPLTKTRKLAGSMRAAFTTLEALPIVDYPEVWRAKSALLEQAFAEFKPNRDLDVFIAEGGEKLDRHCAFETRKAAEPPDPARHRYRAFLQWLAERQLARAAKCNNLYRDLAVGSAFDGGEITEAPDHFASGVSLGAPPDPFARQGQVWNLPPFSPVVLAQSSYEPMRAILTANMRHAAALRIDHIAGFLRQFWVPEGAEGNSGTYVRFPLEALIAITAIESERARCMIVGEDLGTIPYELHPALGAANILSYRILWFEREGQRFKPSSIYPKRALTCLSSHDLPTFKGWRRGRDIEIERELRLIDDAAAARARKSRSEDVKSLDAATGPPAGDEDAACIAAHGFLAATPSAVMLVQADDLAEETEPLNVPGTDLERPNWRRRLSCSVDELAQRPLARAILDRVKQER